MVQYTQKQRGGTNMERYLLSAILFTLGMSFIFSNVFFHILENRSAIIAGVGFGIAAGFIYYQRIKRK